MADNIIESRKDAIAAAVASAGPVPQVEEPIIQKQEDKKEETPTEEKKETSTPQETAEQKQARETEEAQIAEQGKQLIQALRNPELAPTVIEFLAKQAGYTKAEVKAAVETKAAAADLSEDLLKILKEDLGPEFDFIADKLVRGIRVAAERIVDEKQADIREQLEKNEFERQQTQSLNAINKLTTEYFGEGVELPNSVNSEMSKYMDRYKPSSDMSVKEYINDAFHFAVGKLGLTKTTAADNEKQKRLDRNRNDAPSRLASERVPSESNIKKDDSKPVTRAEAVRAAVIAAQKEFGSN